MFPPGRAGPITGPTASARDRFQPHANAFTADATRTDCTVADCTERFGPSSKFAGWGFESLRACQRYQIERPPSGALRMGASRVPSPLTTPLTGSDSLFTVGSKHVLPGRSIVSR